MVHLIQLAVRLLVVRHLVGVGVEVEQLHKVERKDELTVSLLQEIIEQQSLDQTEVTVSIGSSDGLLGRSNIDNPDMKI